MSDKCPTCGQDVPENSRIIAALNAWNKKPWDALFSHVPGHTVNVPNLGDVVVVAKQDPSDFNHDEGYAFQGTEPPTFLILLINGVLYRKDGHTDSYTRYYFWKDGLTKVTALKTVKEVWK
jgi:hypothetical protein